MATQAADSLQLLDLLCFWDQVKDRIKSFALVGTSKRAHDDDLASLRSILTELNHIRVELAFVNSDYIVAFPFVS